MTDKYRSWGFATASRQRAIVPRWAPEIEQFPKAQEQWGNHSRLAFGRGRSYGDSCLNSAGYLVDTSALSRFIHFDRETGNLSAEAGITLGQILDLVIPAGWFLPVSPGTRYATLGGAIANDVHGKNHHVDGTFGRFVSRLSVHRSNGQTVDCSPRSRSDLFNATIGGLGLTGVITRASLHLIPITSDQLAVRFDRFRGIDQFMSLSSGCHDSHQYSVAWLDCVSRGKNFARGVFMSANHLDERTTLDLTRTRKRIGIPFSLPSRILNKYTIGAFNSAYYLAHKPRHARTVCQHYKSFFYPLDAIGNWNRIYGTRGFHQYQFVVPPGAESVLETLLKKIVSSGAGSFLAVLKEFGTIKSPGLLSFPRPGLCLALDFADRGDATVQLIRALDLQVREAGGAAYPAKDRLMPAESFRAYFPRLNEFLPHVDPESSSDFWRRVSG